MAEISLVLVGDVEGPAPRSLDGRIGSPLKNGTGSEPNLSKPIKDHVREVPVPVFQQTGTQRARVVHVDDLAAAARLLDDTAAALRLIVLAQSRPGQYSADALDALRARDPLARVWRVLGSWCEGETRSGQPPPGCLATYWHEWPLRRDRELAQAALGGCPAWALPLTASPDERALAAAEYPLERGSGRIAVCARHAEAAMSLVEVCRLGGYEAVVNWDWLRAGSPETRETPAPRGACPSFSTGANEAVAVGAPCGEGAVLLHGLGEIGTVPDASGSAQIKAVIWDTTAEEMSHPDAVEGLRALAGHAPIVALVNFPRPDDCRRAMAAGVAAVIAKPFSIHDLLWQIARVVAGPPSTKSQNGVGS